MNYSIRVYKSRNEDHKILIKELVSNFFEYRDIDLKVVACYSKKGYLTKACVYPKGSRRLIVVIDFANRCVKLVSRNKVTFTFDFNGGLK